MHIIISLALLLSSTAVFADTYRFCFEPWAPYGQRNEKGESSGSTVEFYQTAFKKMGHELTFVQLPPERCWDGVKDGSHRCSGFYDAPTNSSRSFIIVVGRFV